MADFRFGRQPFRFEPTVFQEPKPEIRAFQPYKPNAEDYRANIAAKMNEPVEEPNQPAGLEKGSLFDIQRQEVNEYPMMDKFSELLGQRPQREDYQPSTLRNIISAIGGVSSGMLGKPEAAVANALGTTEKLRYVPFERATQDWTGKIAGYGEGAKLELQKADKENRFLNALNTAYRNQGQVARWEGQNTYDAGRLSVAQAALLQKVQDAESKGWTQVRSNGRIYMVKPGEEPQDYGADTLAGIQQQNANTAAAGQRSRDVIGRGNLANQRTRTGIMQQDANTRVTNAEINRGRLDVAQQNADTGAYRADIAGLQYNRQLQNDIFKQTLDELKFNRGDDAPAARAMTPGQQSAAFGLAQAQVIMENPELIDVINPENNMVDPLADPHLINEFSIRVKQKIGEIISPAVNINTDPKATLPKTTAAPAPPRGTRRRTTGSVTTPSPTTPTPPLTFKRFEDLK